MTAAETQPFQSAEIERTLGRAPTPEELAAVQLLRPLIQKAEKMKISDLPKDGREPFIARGSDTETEKERKARIAKTTNVSTATKEKAAEIAKAFDKREVFVLKEAGVSYKNIKQAVTLLGGEENAEAANQPIKFHDAPLPHCECWKEGEDVCILPDDIAKEKLAKFGIKLDIFVPETAYSRTR